MHRGRSGCGDVGIEDVKVVRALFGDGTDVSPIPGLCEKGHRVDEIERTADTLEACRRACLEKARLGGSDEDEEDDYASCRHFSYCPATRRAGDAEKGEQPCARHGRKRECALFASCPDVVTPGENGDLKGFKTYGGVGGEEAAPTPAPRSFSYYK